MLNIIKIAVFVVAAIEIFVLTEMVFDHPVRDVEFQGNNEYLEELKSYRKDAAIAVGLTVAIVATGAAHLFIGGAVTTIAFFAVVMVPVALICLA